jgi:ABC-type amino acid transport substrate-binding protein
LKIVDELDELKYFIVTGADDTKLKSDINKALETMKKDGTPDAIISKWD